MEADKNFETRSKGGKSRWSGVSKEERSRIMSEIGKKRFNTHDENNTGKTKKRDPR